MEKQLETGKLKTYETVHRTQKDRANIDRENQDVPGRKFMDEMDKKLQMSKT